MARFFLPALHAAKADVAEVFDPLKIADRHPTGIGIHVGYDNGALLAQNFVGTCRNWSVCGFNDQRRLNTCGVPQVDDPFKSGRDENVAGLFEHFRSVCYVVAVGVSRNSPVFGDPRAHHFHVEPVWIVERAVMFDDASDDASVFFHEEFGRVIAHVAEALHDDTLALERAFQPGLGHTFPVTEKLAQRVLDATPRCLNPARYATRVQRLAGHTGITVDVGRIHAFVLVRDPGHFTLARSHIRRGHVLAGIDEVALDQLVCKATCDLLHLMRAVFARINTQPPFGSTKGRLDQSAFVGHQRGQCFDFVLINRTGKTNATFDWFHMLRMHRPVTGKCLDLAPQTHAEPHCIGRIADPNFLFQPWRKVHEPHGPVEHLVYAFAETRL